MESKLKYNNNYLFSDIRKLKTAIKQIALKNPVTNDKCYRGIECSE